jgi:hypothetical protein
MLLKGFLIGQGRAESLSYYDCLACFSEAIVIVAPPHPGTSLKKLKALQNFSATFLRLF